MTQSQCTKIPLNVCLRRGWGGNKYSSREFSEVVRIHLLCVCFYFVLGLQIIELDHP